MSKPHRTLTRYLATVIVLIGLTSGCSDVGYNPYVQNDGKRPVGKQAEDIMEKANDALSSADARFENAFN